MKRRCVSAQHSSPAKVSGFEALERHLRLGLLWIRCPVPGSVADDGLVARKRRLAPWPGDAGDAALSTWGSFSLDHRPWLQAVDEFASNSLTSR